MRELMFRAFNDGEMFYSRDGSLEDFFAWHEKPHRSFTEPSIIMQYTGSDDKNGSQIYIKDICRFDNGDTFHVERERWLEVFGQWIGDPECEDQLRDFYRAGRATIIGNSLQHPSLLEET